MNDPARTKEPQYSMLFDVLEKHGSTRLGLMVNESWNQDPKRSLFTLARYRRQDFDPVFIADVKERMNPHWPFEIFVHDILAGPVAGRFDAAVAMRRADTSTAMV
jgi:hypothetical protein